MQFIIDDIKKTFTSGSRISQLILINIIAFVMIGLIRVFTGFGQGVNTVADQLVRQLAMSQDAFWTITHPWTILTHMFLHLDFWHILWNMVFLYWFGRIVEDLIGSKHILPLYLYGGLAGALFIMLSGVILYPGEIGLAYGASAAVMAIVITSALVAPDYIINLILIGPVRLKYIVLVVVLMDVLALGNDVNTGGHMAHIGGLIMGYIYFSLLKNGVSIIPNINLAKKKERGRVVNLSSYNQKKKDKIQQKRKVSVDLILDKIKKEGIESLSEEEKETLYRASTKGEGKSDS